MGAIGEWPSPVRQRSRALVLLLCLASVPGVVRSDGGFIGRDPIWEPSQVAVLRYDESSKVEDLILQVQFFGETKDFAWIVPVPSVPEVSPYDSELFRECALLTAPINRNRTSGWSCHRDGYVGTQPLDGDVTIYGDETVGIYRAITIGANNSPVLVDSLQAWGYLHEESLDRLLEVFDHYLEKSWVFVAMRIDTTQAMDPAEDGYWYGALDPIKLRFESEEPVYPLRISSISGSDHTDLRIYAISDSRVDFDGALTEYANAIDASELRYIREAYPNLGTLVSEGSYLTRLSTWMGPQQMDDDIYLEPAETNEEYRPIRYSAVLPSVDFMLLGLGVVVLFVRAKAKQRSTTR